MTPRNLTDGRSVESGRAKGHPSDDGGTVEALVRRKNRSTAAGIAALLDTAEAGWHGTPPHLLMLMT